MGVVDEHRVVRGGGHHLDAALHPPGRPQCGGTAVQRQAQHQPAGQHTQSVVDGKASGYRQPYPGNGVPGHRLKLYPLREQAEVLGREIRLVPALRVSKGRNRHRFGIVPARLVVQVEHRSGALAEQQPLGVPVGLHGTVEVQVVLGQIGEDTRPEGDAVQAMEHQGVGGCLHHHVGTPRIRHLPQQLLHLVGLRRGAVGGQALLPDQVLVGADQPHLCVEAPLQHGLEQIGGGGLSVGPGDRQQGQFPGRMAEPVG